MKVGAVLLTLLALVVVAVTVSRLRRSAAWPSVEGTIESSSIREVYNRPGSIGAEDLEAIEYEFVVRYRYSVGGRDYVGARLTVGLPAVFSRESEASDMLARFREGVRVPVFYDPADPGTSALVTAGGVGVGGMMTVALLIFLVIGAIAVGGLFITGQIGGPSDDGIERPFHPE